MSELDAVWRAPITPHECETCWLAETLGITFDQALELLRERRRQNESGCDRAPAESAGGSSAGV